MTAGPRSRTTRPDRTGPANHEGEPGETEGTMLTLTKESREGRLWIRSLVEGRDAGGITQAAEARGVKAGDLVETGSIPGLVPTQRRF